MKKRKTFFQRLKEAFFPERSFASGQVNDAIDKDEEQWRKISGKGIARLPDQAKILRVANYVYNFTALGRSIPRFVSSVLVGDGWTVRSDNEKVQEVLDEFDRENRWSMLRSRRIEDLIIDGELFLPVEVNEFGKVRLGYIAPEKVIEVKYEDPYDPDTPSYIKVASAGQSRELKVVSVTKDPASPSYGKLEGEVFYIAINKRTKMERGISDLFHIADAILNYDDFLLSEIDRAVLKRSFLYDVTLEGADEEEIREWLRTHDTPKPGSINVHNELEKWSVVEPSLGSEDTTKLADVILSYIATGASLSKAFLNATEEMNRATVQALSDPDTPFARFLARRQAEWLEFETLIYRFVIEKNPYLRDLSEEEKRFEIIPATISKRDMHSVAATLRDVAQALSMAFSSGFISQEQASKIFLAVAEDLGLSLLQESQEEDFGLKTYMDIVEPLVRLNRAVKLVREGKLTQALDELDKVVENAEHRA